jgi:hypothetical protein
MDAYRAVVDKRDQRAFLATPLPEESLRRVLQAARMTGSSKNSEPNRLVVVRDRERLAFGFVDPARATAPKSVARRRKPLDELVHWETW